ncbi:TrfB-related DNA-binding protein [Xylophilus sp.]|uniref:TrfB-related DNA-binding protein n=1 Tax=Xylophilus sp. TaxID=2653893 RepID=UPI002D8089BE|nr:TrfB-related DNA-binding protein [Xylophilus sp.]
MTADEFEQMRPRLSRRFGDEAIQLARRVLVDGVSQVQTASDAGVTKQRISHLIRSVLDAMQEHPPEWRLVEEWLPPELADQVRKMAVQARQAIS